MRISDWSSDVCSSDLLGMLAEHPVLLPRGTVVPFAPVVAPDVLDERDGQQGQLVGRAPLRDPAAHWLQSSPRSLVASYSSSVTAMYGPRNPARAATISRSEEHTSELQSLMRNLVCRLLLDKKKHLKQL